MKLFRTQSLLFTSSLAVASLLSASLHAAQISEDKLNAAIKQFLLDNPQVIIDSLQQHQVRQQAEQIKAQQEAAREVIPELLKKDLPYGEGGNPKGDVTIVEFFDYNCPACKMMFESIDTLLEQDNQVRVIFVEYPIFGQQSEENAKLSFAVAELYPEKYYKFHHAIMQQKGKVSPDSLLEIAGNMGMDKDQLKKEAQKEKYTKQIAQDRTLGDKLKITGTPAAIIGEKVVGGALDINNLKQYIQWAREDN